MKNPIVKIEKATNATSCCTLARANTKAVCANMVRPSSAESGADHVHEKFKTQKRQIDDCDREYYFYAEQCFDLRLTDPGHPIRPGPTPPQ